jgi:hypothetical protein
MKRTLLITFALIALAASPAASQTNVTVGAGGVFPAGSTFGGVPVSGLQSGYGVEINGTSALGQFCTTLLGVNVLGQQQYIIIEGTASSGAVNAANIVTFSGTSTVNMGNGTPPTPGVPFTATITTDANDQGAIGLRIGATTLPNATVNAGTMTIK